MTIDGRASANTTHCRASLAGRPSVPRSDALTQEGFITSLAEPNLTAMSGQTASFLAGGEFPVPISGTSATTGGFPTITVEFKSFGVSLAFTPTIIDANHLNLRVRPEVSELTTVGEVSVPITATRDGHDPRPDRPPRRNLGRARQRRKLCARRPAAAHLPAARLQGPVDRRHSDPRRAVSLGPLSARRDRPRHHRHPLSRATGARRASPPRPTASCCRAIRSGCSSATNIARGCPHPRAARSMPAARA